MADNGIKALRKSIKEGKRSFHEYETINVKVRDEGCVFSEYNFDQQDMLNPDLVNNLEERAEAIGKKSKLRVKFFLLNDDVDEDSIKRAYQEKFKMKFEECDKHIKRINTYSITCLLIGIALIVCSMLLKGSSLISETLCEIVLVSAWVFMWEAVEKCFLTRKEVLDERRNMARLYYADVIIIKSFERATKKTTTKNTKTTTAKKKEVKKAVSE